MKVKLNLEPHPPFSPSFSPPQIHLLLPKEKCLAMLIYIGLEKKKPINQVKFSENYDLSKKAYIDTKFCLSSFFWYQIKDVSAMHGRARTISNGDVKIDLRRIGG